MWWQESAPSVGCSQHCDLYWAVGGLIDYEGQSWWELTICVHYRLINCKLTGCRLMHWKSTVARHHWYYSVPWSYLLMDSHTVLADRGVFRERAAQHCTYKLSQPCDQGLQTRGLHLTWVIIWSLLKWKTFRKIFLMRVKIEQDRVVNSSGSDMAIFIVQRANTPKTGMILKYNFV